MRTMWDVAAKSTALGQVRAEGQIVAEAEDTRMAVHAQRAFELPRERARRTARIPSCPGDSGRPLLGRRLPQRVRTVPVSEGRAWGAASRWAATTGPPQAEAPGHWRRNGGARGAIG